MANAIKADIIELVEKELAATNENFPLFHSNHESYAFLLEGVEEVHEETINLELTTKQIWDDIKEGHTPESLYPLYSIVYRIAIDLAIEAIQYAAMARKAIISDIEIRQIDRMEGGPHE